MREKARRTVDARDGPSHDDLATMNLSDDLSRSSRTKSLESARLCHQERRESAMDRDARRDSSRDGRALNAMSRRPPLLALHAFGLFPGEGGASIASAKDRSSSLNCRR